MAETPVSMKSRGSARHGRVDREALDPHPRARGDRRAAIDGTAQAVEHASKHVRSHSEQQRLRSQPDPRAGEAESGGRLQHLDDHRGFVECGDAAEAHDAVVALDFHRGVQAHARLAPGKEQRALDAG